MPKSRRMMRALGLLATFPAALAWTAPKLLPNASFEQGDGQPTGWSLKGGGAWGSDDAVEGKRFVTVTSKGGGQWQSGPIAFEPGAVYELRFRCRYRPAALSPSANAVVGPAFSIRVVALSASESEPQWQQHVIRFVAPTPVDPAMSRIGLGQWQLQGAIDYDALELYPVKLAHRNQDGMVLGQGESVSGNRYRFVAPLGTWRSVSRPIEAYNNRFHDNRWRFAKSDSSLTYHHYLAGRMQTEASVRPNVWFHAKSSWRLMVEASVDGRDYRLLGTVQHDGPKPSFDVPRDMLPAEAVWVRLRTDATVSTHPVFFQVNGYEYQAKLSGPVCEVSGVSTFVTVLEDDPSIALDPLIPGRGALAFAVRAANKGADEVAIRPKLTVTAQQGPRRVYSGRAMQIPAGGRATITIPYQVGAPGRYRMELSLGGALRTRLAAETTIPVLHASHYGERLPCSTESVVVWWASPGWKVSRDRAAPEAVGPVARLSLARNEAECTQIVVHPKQALRGLTATTGDLRSSAGHVLPASAVELLRVRYVRVEYASDRLGAVGEWPDPLPPFRDGVDVEPGTNLPIWLRVRAPKNTRAGVYRGNVTISADAFEARVPVEVEVYDFTLPDETTCLSLFGFGWANVPRYHRLATPAQQRVVLDEYLRCFSEHRISPYNPAPLDRFTYWWDTGSKWEGGQFVTGDAHSGKKSLLAQDASDTANPQARYVELLPVSGKPLRVSLWRRNASLNRPASIYLCHYDRGRQWFYGRNRHMTIPSSIQWARFETTVPSFPSGTAFIRVLVQGCRYSEKGEQTGSIWLDDVSIVDTGTGEELIEGGDFEAAKRVGPDTGVTFDWAVWDRAMERAVNEYHFNSFVFRVPGLGGGTFHARSPGSLLRYAQGTPEHLALFHTWCNTAREHLLSRGLLGKAVCYPFDEPAPKDYAFVVDQLRLLKGHFPGLHRMVPMNLGAADDFISWIDYWCPVLSSHNRAFAAERQKAGEQYTWYISCSPKAPYIANFIDRAATDLRVWLWQTWQEGVDGILIWQTLYWHSPSAYPKSLQNPYEDSMSWVRGYGTKPGERRRWNVGDGRFMYPPEAATGTQPQTVLDGPVTSIRWEALRDGVEDYEYLAMLKRLLLAKQDRLSADEVAQYETLLAVPASISSSLTSYTRDPAPIETRRHEIAKAIERLNEKR